MIATFEKLPRCVVGMEAHSRVLSYEFEDLPRVDPSKIFGDERIEVVNRSTTVEVNIGEVLLGVRKKGIYL